MRLNIDYSSDIIKKGELEMKVKPLQQVDYVHYRKTDRKPERQDGSGAIFWVAAAALCWIVILVLAGNAGYFN